MWGWAQLALNSIMFLQAYWYIIWFRADTRPNRVNVTRGFKYVFIFNLVQIFAAFFVLLLMPAKYLPDKVPDGKGGFQVWKPEMKQKIKQGILFAIVFMGFLASMVYYYYYSVARRWSSLQPLLKREINSAY